MALVVEDGTIVSGANSYVSDDDYTTYATSRGNSVGADATIREQQLLNAMDFLEAHRDDFKGAKIQRDQPLQWPRYDVFIDGYQIDSVTIPEELKRAQMELAIMAHAGVDLAPSGNLENVQSQSLGSMSISYFNGGTYKTVQTKSVDQFLDILLNGRGRFRSVRI